jgi:hypothetical protein
MSESNKEVYARLEAGLKFINEVEQQIGFQLPEEDHLLFSRIWVRLRGLAHNESLSISERNNYSKIERHVGDLQECLAALFYHTRNVRILEEALDSIIERYRRSTPSANGGHFNPTLTNRFTFEYHAFAFASTRCVNHIFPVVGYMCFKKYCPSRKSFEKYSERKNAAIVDSVNAILKRHSKLEKLFSRENQKSIRDLIAHEQFLSAGSLHIDTTGAKLIGILPSNISHFDGERTPDVYYLSQIMDNQAEQIRKFVFEMLEVVATSYMKIQAPCA